MSDHSGSIRPDLDRMDAYEEYYEQHSAPRKRVDSSLVRFCTGGGQNIDGTEPTYAPNIEVEEHSAGQSPVQTGRSSPSPVSLVSTPVRTPPFPGGEPPTFQNVNYHPSHSRTRGRHRRSIRRSQQECPSECSPTGGRQGSSRESSDTQTYRDDNTSFAGTEGQTGETDAYHEASTEATPTLEPDTPSHCSFASTEIESAPSNMVPQAPFPFNEYDTHAPEHAANAVETYERSFEENDRY